MKILFILAGVLLIMTAFSLFSIPKELLIPREVLFGNPVKANPQISPNGQTIAYLAPDEGVLNIWLRQVEGGEDRVITQDRVRGIRQYFWAQDSRHLFFLQDEGGDENTHLFLVDSETAETRDLTPFPGTRVQILQTDKETPEQILIAMNRDNPKVYDVYRLAWKTGNIELAAKNSGSVSRWIADSRLSVLGQVIADGKGGYQVFTRDTEASEWKPTAEWGVEDNLSCGVIGFSKDAKDLFLIDSRDFSAGRLVKLERASGKKQMLSQNPDYDVVQVLLNPETDEPQAAIYFREKPEWDILDEAIRADLNLIGKNHPGFFSIASRDDADRFWILRVESDIQPAAYFLYNRASKTETFLFEQYPDLKKFRLSAMQPVSFQSRDGLKLNGYLTLPAGKKKPAPMVLKVHGGPWSRDMWRYDPAAQWLANRGYAVLQINFRGSTTYGKAFVNAGNREWGGKMQDDLTDAVQWAIGEGIADPKKIAIYGASYGGYAALAGAAFTPDLFRAAIAVVGPSNLISFLKSMPPYWSNEAANVYHRVGHPDQDADFLKKRSPLFSAEKIRVPMLIAQGANDPRVKKAESEQIVEALQKHKIEHQYLLFPDEGHGFARPENQFRFYAAAETFLAKNLGGRSQD